MMTKDKMHKFAELANEILQCRLCREQFGFEPSPILFGGQQAKIV